MDGSRSHIPLDEDEFPTKVRRRESDLSRDDNKNYNKKRVDPESFRDESLTFSQRNLLEAKQDKLNTVFGVRPWATRVTAKDQYPIPDGTTIAESTATDNFCTFGNILWVVLFGWWMALPFMLASGILLATFIGRRHAAVCWSLKSYLFWPFGKYIVAKIKKSEDAEISLNEEHLLIPSGGDGFPTSSPKKLGPYILWLIVASILVFPFLIIGLALNWFFVVSIPMAKVLWTLLQVLIKKPTSIVILPNYNKAQTYPVLLCTYRAFNVLYFEYEVRGINIVFVNLMPIVLARVILILIHFFVEFHLFDPLVQFFLNVLCSVPITFYIGTSIASIACQTNYTIGAILNATFGSVTELILFTLAINEGHLNDLILYSMTGSLLCDMLLLPGLAMIAGGVKYKEQKFSSSAAAISSLLLFVAVIGAFTPTIFYHLFGQYSSICEHCVLELNHDNSTRMTCSVCAFPQNSIAVDPVFDESVKKLLYLSCVVLPLAYVIGLVFTFKTHKHIFDEDEAEEEGSAEWTILFSVFVLLCSISCFGFLAEDSVNLLQDVLEELNLTQAFLGVTIIALTPAATEIANAIKFALTNQISLSVSIGSASSIQVVLIQMPFLVLISIISDENHEPFPLVFPLMSVFTVILSVLTFNYISSEGKTNYFVGSSMCIMYLLIIASFYFIPNSKSVPHLPPEAPSPLPVPAPTYHPFPEPEPPIPVPSLPSSEQMRMFGDAMRTFRK